MTPDKFLTKCIPEPNSGCWIWEQGQYSSGYGAASHNGRSEYAHRLSYSLFKGPITNKQEVRHVCDNKYCVNPDHLKLGSHADNMMDMAQRKRGNKLTDADVLSILADKRPKRQIAKDFGIALSYVYHIKTGIANRAIVKEYITARLKR